MTDVYSLKLELAGQIYESSGKTPADAITSFVPPKKIVKAGVLTFAHGEKAKSMIVYPFQIRSITWKIKRPLLINQFTHGLK